jgi:ribose/xylose/arabinose/galactoside ABC-type transport system permease subunit
MLIVALFVFVFLNHTKYGHFFYMIGSNQEAAKLSGIPVKKYKTMAYMMNFPYYSQNIVKGIVLILALSLTYYRKNN